MVRQRCVFLIPVLFFVCSFVHSVEAQGPFRARISKSVTKIETSGDKRNDLEGALWEYKVIDSKSKKTKTSGILRIKQTSVFAVRVDKSKPAKSKKSRGGYPLRQALTKRMEHQADVKVGLNGERIGDVEYGIKKSKTKKQIKIKFDQDDDYVLSGYAVLKQSSKNKAGVWTGYYNDDKKKRWKFELRKVEE